MSDAGLSLGIAGTADSGATVEARAGGLETEYALLSALREGAESAFETLIERYQQPVYNLVYRLMDDPGDASDVVQEVFLKVFRNVGNFRGGSSLKTWIYRIALNEAHNHRRWFSRHKRQEVGFESDIEGDTNYQEILPDHGRSAFELVADREMHTLIEEALGELNPTFRTAVVLRDLEDLNYEEIAEVLQISLGTVKSRIQRGREALKRALTAKLQQREMPPAWAQQAAVAK